jgi:5-methylcytosine-specific restriction endonuclease McrA
MPPKRLQPSGDPALKSAAWRAVRAYWVAVATPQCQAPRCLLPGVPIRYTGKRGPDSLDVGHRVPRARDGRTTWAIADTRPEHARCNRSAGAYIGKRNTPKRAQPRPIQSQKW